MRLRWLAVAVFVCGTSVPHGALAATVTRSNFGRMPGGTMVEAATLRFGSARLAPGQVYRNEIIYTFSHSGAAGAGRPR